MGPGGAVLRGLLAGAVVVVCQGPNFDPNFGQGTLNPFPGGTLNPYPGSNPGLNPGGGSYLPPTSYPSPPPPPPPFTGGWCETTTDEVAQGSAICQRCSSPTGDDCPDGRACHAEAWCSEDASTKCSDERAQELCIFIAPPGSSGWCETTADEVAENTAKCQECSSPDDECPDGRACHMESRCLDSPVTKCSQEGEGYLPNAYAQASAPP